MRPEAVERDYRSPGAGGGSPVSTAMQWLISMVRNACEALLLRGGARLQPKVTRFELIDRTGRVYTRYGVEVALSYQDGGRTLKVFIGDR
jgi:hypothetical protein